jgi:hypothetical protein
MQRHEDVVNTAAKSQEYEILEMQFKSGEINGLTTLYRLAKLGFDYETLQVILNGWLEDMDLVAR